MDPIPWVSIIRRFCLHLGRKGNAAYRPNPFASRAAEQIRDGSSKFGEEGGLKGKIHYILRLSGLDWACAFGDSVILVAEFRRLNQIWPATASPPFRNGKPTRNRSESGLGTDEVIDFPDPNSDPFGLCKSPKVLFMKPTSLQRSS